MTCNWLGEKVILKIYLSRTLTSKHMYGHIWFTLEISMVWTNIKDGIYFQTYSMDITL
jgi:hypothetical protein